MRRGHGVRRARSRQCPQGGQGGQPAGMDPCWAALPVPGAAPGASSPPFAWSATWGGEREVYGACQGDLRALPCRMLEAASLLSTEAAGCTACHARCSSIAPLVQYFSAHRGPFVGSVAPRAGGSGTDFLLPLSLVQRAGWPSEPCVAPTRGPGPPHRGLVSRARARDSGRHRAARLLAATLASAWSRFGGRVRPFHCRSWKACSQWYTVVGTPSWSSRSAGCAAAGHTPGLAARALSFSRTWSRRAWCLPVDPVAP